MKYFIIIIVITSCFFTATAQENVFKSIFRLSPSDTILTEREILQDNQLKIVPTKDNKNEIELVLKLLKNKNSLELGIDFQFIDNDYEFLNKLMNDIEINGLYIFHYEADSLPKKMFYSQLIHTIVFDDCKIKYIDCKASNTNHYFSLHLNNMNYSFENIILAFSETPSLCIDNTSINENYNLFSKLSQLKSLYISNVANLNFSLLFQELAKNNTLVSLTIENQLVDDLSDNIFKIKSLKKMYIGCSQFVNKADKAQKLNISCLYIINTDFDSIPNYFLSKSLRTLYLHNNKLKACPDITQLDSLIELSITTNQLKTFDKNIEKLKTLEYLTLTNNRIQELHESIWHLPKLNRLDLDCNNLSYLDRGIQSSKIDFINISHNKFSEFPIELIKNPHIKYVVIKGLKFNYENIRKMIVNSEKKSFVLSSDYIIDDRIIQPKPRKKDELYDLKLNDDD